MDDEFYVFNPDDVINAVFDALGVPDARSSFVGMPTKGSVLSFIIVKKYVDNDKNKEHYQLADVDGNIIYDPYPGLNLTNANDPRNVHIYMPEE